MNERQNIDSSWTQSLSRGQLPNHADLREHLLAVHRDHAGFTESCALRCRDKSGRNSYELLADVVDPIRHSRVLDLACGSGVLLEICSRRCGPNAELTGVDMSAEELALAGQRGLDPTIKLYEGIAQDLCFIADGSFDVVLCHWALTLMDQVPLVLREVKRVLKPDGVFAAIVDGDPATTPGYSEIHDLIYNLVRREQPNFGEIDLGDPRVRTGQALKQLAIESFEGAQLNIEPMVFDLHAPPDVLAREAAGFFYASFMLSPPAHRQMLEELEALFAGQRQAGRSRFALPVNRLVIHH